LRIGVVSDIHGNATALEAVLKRLGEERLDHIVCLGDIVGYGAEPSRCIALVRAHCRLSIAGNHDRAAVDPRVLIWFNQDAAAAARWTREALTAEELSFLEGLPPEAVDEQVRLCHGAPSNPDRYLFDAAGAGPEFEVFDEVLALVGHTHVPGVYACRAGDDPILASYREELTAETAYTLQAGHRYIVNPGSVGQPRDRDPRASAMVVDLAAGTLTLARVVYDIGEAQRTMSAVGLPERLIRRLAAGT
jgi:predicted phosphodiesterase